MFAIYAVGSAASVRDSPISAPRVRLPRKPQSIAYQSSGYSSPFTQSSHLCATACPATPSAVQEFLHDASDLDPITNVLLLAEMIFNHLAQMISVRRTVTACLFYFAKTIGLRLSLASHQREMSYSLSRHRGAVLISRLLPVICGVLCPY